MSSVNKKQRKLCAFSLFGARILRCPYFFLNIFLIPARFQGLACPVLSPPDDLLDLLFLGHDLQSSLSRGDDGSARIGKGEHLL